MHVLVTRPEPDGIKLKGLIERMGHAATVAPLLSVSYEDLDPAELEGVTTLIATSRNALRALVGSDALPRARRIPLFAVGSGTAAEARRGLAVLALFEISVATGEEALLPGFHSPSARAPAI